MSTHAQITVLADTLIDADPVDYLIVAIYFGFVLGIGVMARRHVSNSVDFFLSGRSLPAWVTGLAFISANLGAEMNASPVTHAGSERPERKKSTEFDTWRLAMTPIPKIGRAHV